MVEPLPFELTAESGLDGVLLGIERVEDGRAFGYKHVAIEHPTKLDPHGRPVVEAVRRVVDEDQAAIVVEIFEKYTSGWSPRRIAADLNGRGIPSPRGGKWQQTAIYGDPDEGTGILCNRLYIGVYQWNRRKWHKDPDTGRRTKRVRDRSEWVETEMPELRILPQELWDKAMARRTALTAEKGERIRMGIRDANDKGRSTGRGPKYIFSGLLKCGVCGANYKVYSSTSYDCGLNLDGGHTACPNRFRLPRKVAEARLLDVLKGELFSKEACDLFVKETTRFLQQQAARSAPDLKRAERDIEAANKEIENIMAAIRAGIITASTKAGLEAAEAAEAGKARAEAQLRLTEATSADTKAAMKVATMLPRALDRYRTDHAGRPFGRAGAQCRPREDPTEGASWGYSLAPGREGPGG